MVVASSVGREVVEAVDRRDDAFREHDLVRQCAIGERRLHRLGDAADGGDAEKKLRHAPRRSRPATTCAEIATRWPGFKCQTSRPTAVMMPMPFPPGMKRHLRGVVNRELPGDVVAHVRHEDGHLRARAHGAGPRLRQGNVDEGELPSELLELPSFHATPP